MSPRPKMQNGDECPHAACPFDGHEMPMVYNGKPTWQTNITLVVAIIVAVVSFSALLLQRADKDTQFVTTARYEQDEVARREMRDEIRLAVRKVDDRLVDLQSELRQLTALLAEQRREDRAK